MRAFVLSTVVAAAGLAAGCSDTPRTNEPIFATAGSGGGGIAGAAGAGGPVAGSPGETGGTGGSASGGQAGRAARGGAGGNLVITGQGGAAGTTALLAPPAPTGLVSLNSDYRTTSLSLLSAMGGSLTGSCVHSTSMTSGTALTISGDAVLPSQPQRGGDIVIVDRGNGLLTFVDPVGCFVARQVPVPGGAKTNPHDVVILSDHKAYVTRYQAGPSSSSQQQVGNDVVVIDPTSGTFQARINLDPYAATASGVGVLARPDRALIADGRVVVSLNQVDAALQTYGTGAVVVIDPATDAVVERVSLPGLFDCEGMDFVPSTHTLLVSCGGMYGDLNQSLQSGLAVVDFSGQTPRLDHVISSVAFDGHPMNFSWVLGAPLPGAPQRAFAGTYDPTGAALDAVFEVDVASGLVIRVGTAAPFSLGIPAVSGDLLFVPEAPAGTPRIQVFDVTGAPQAVSGFTPDVTTNLPPRQIAWY
ncbi:MAG TPA: hypothetical protein VN962_11960 [Polyangia bacterium]|nr:hypothetical protein [Polyangia bacterium]